MKILLAVVTCEKFRARANSQRETWVPLVKGADVKFFLGHQLERQPAVDEVFLPVRDDYHGLPEKVRSMVTWALANRYDKVIKLDDDVYCYPDRLLSTVPEEDYVGYINETPPTWCSGFTYWLSKKAMGHVIHSPLPVVDPDDPATWAEDRWVGSLLAAEGIQPTQDLGIVIADCTPRINILGPEVKAACEFTPQEMHEAHGGPRGWKARSEMLADRRRRQQQGKQIMRGNGTKFP